MTAHDPARLVDERTEASVALLSDVLDAQIADSTPDGPSMMADVLEGIGRVSLGGKHLRARLVHIASGPVDGADADEAILLGACVDLLHGAFLIHDDIIDRDDIRRGEATIHAAVRDDLAAAGHDAGDAAHDGTSLAIIAGDLALIGVQQMILGSDLSDARARRALQILGNATTVTLGGELLDIIHGTRPGSASGDDVRCSSWMKTSVYTFEAPLQLGAMIAGRDEEVMVPIGRDLGRAYQAADDLAGAFGATADTGKTAGGDVERGRSTLVTMRRGTEADVIAQVVAEGREYLDRARGAIADAGLPDDVAAGLRSVAASIENSLVRHER
ncbi:polyprenyl synthetase family protein [uncultured Corynebacterium sp.]|uniref:polyprenyl synthetase family protein n=1 Tax=uncultured Corynebacterium sp. TaxID=159447 RepID=UPI0025F80EC9|nr:polyprenyl synthetase family protein [uncultured Corynebacterium sp.]